MQCTKTSSKIISILARRFSVAASLSAKKSFVRDGLNLNVAAVGAFGHGKTTLSSSLTKASAGLYPNKAVEVKLASDLDNTKPERELGHSQNAAHFLIYGRKNSFSVSDLPGGTKYLKNLIAHMSQMDATILVISGDCCCETTEGMKCV